MSFNLTVRLFIMVALCYFLWDLTLGGTQNRAFALAGTTLDEIREIDIESVASKIKNREPISAELYMQANYYKGLQHSKELTLSQHLNIVRYRLTFGPRLIALPVISSIGKAASFLIPPLKDDSDPTGYSAGVLLLGSIALPSMLLLHCDNGKNPIRAWAGTLVCFFLLLQLGREIIGNPMAVFLYFIALPAMLYASWKLLYQYSQKVLL